MEFGFGISPSFTAPSVQNPYLYGLPSTDTLRIDDLLDFSNNNALFSNSTVSDSHILGSQPSGNVKIEPNYSYHSHSHSNVSSFADDIYIPTEEEAELEWLSKFVEDSFTDAPYPSNYLQPATISHIKQEYGTQNLTPDQRGARTKRIKLVNHNSSSSSTSSSSSSDFTGQMVGNRRRIREESGEGGVRRCTHCASDKTPQWRTGPHGPKTLCNACGVRFKSGRLVPEYRPAASPTFVLTQHSNSHRKVMELRRQKEQLRGIIRHDG